MEKKLALLIGVLILLPMTQFFGADLQVEANSTTNSDPKISSDDLNSISSNSEDVNKKIESSGEKDLKKVQNTRNTVNGGSDNQNNNNKIKNRKHKKELDVNVGQNKVNEESKTNIDQSDRSKKGFESDESVQNGSVKDYDSDFVEPKETKRSEEDQNRKSEKSQEEGNNINNSNNNVKKEKKEIEDVGENKVDECYSSVKCSDKDNVLIACLRVPGNESPHLSLLIQNKGNVSLTVDIFAPDFVELQSTKVQLQEKETKEVEVSIGNREARESSMMVLKSGNQRVCNLDFKDLISSSHKYKYLRFPSRKPTILVFLSFSVLLIAFGCWTLRRSHDKKRKILSGRGVFGYKKVGPELPLGGVSKQNQNQNQKRSDGNEGWDDSWGDDWDDEEAPRTPSKPSPSFSSKRIASRRLTKETRKD